MDRRAARADLLIIGAGPYGLATAAAARERGLHAVVAGRSMSFWHEHMPEGMLLRSPLDWQMDPQQQRTILAFLDRKGVDPAECDPLPLRLFQEYGEWFRTECNIEPEETWIEQLRRLDDYFEAKTIAGGAIAARNVVLATGFSAFAYMPADLAALIPAGRFSHSCDTVDFSSLEGKRCLVIGGRQSAYESAALMAESGVSEIHVCHRHDQPRFAPSDWSWVAPMVDATANQRGWFRKLSEQEREDIRRRFWAEGRLKLEPWLAPRIARAEIHCWPGTELTACVPAPSGALRVELGSQASLTVDHILFATGYRVDMTRLPLLSQGSIRTRLQLSDGFPILDEDFQSSVEGLFIAGLPATRDFGPFFGFVSGAALASRLIVDRIAR
jgi:cation diffusion facilitator CzcD-associated flavoprotein CzcO